MRILHIINLHVRGGIQTSFEAFLTATIKRHTVTHGIVVRRKIGEKFKLPLECMHVFNQKKFFGLKIPPGLKMLGRYKVNGIIDNFKPDVVLSWGSLSAHEFIEPCKRHGIPLVYWEHGFAWKGDGRSSKKFAELLQQVQLTICVSVAAQRILELRWQYPGKSELISNALRPELLPSKVTERVSLEGRSLRLGVAGRLESIKGFCLALHTLRELNQKGMRYNLLIAGEGRQREALLQLTRSLNLEEQVEFLGFISDMSHFFRSIDLFLCPSLREPFGLVSLEAQAHGCPVVVSRVDGLPETLLEGETGFSVKPGRPISDYEDYGGRLHDLPALVYDPDSDSLQPPGFVAPAAFAEAIIHLACDPQRYAAASRRAAQWVRDEFSFQHHAEAVMACLQRAVRGE